MATIRIVTIGDSNTANTLHTGDVEWPHVMRSALASAHPSQTYVLYNTAIAGWGTGNYLNGATAVHPITGVSGTQNLQTLCFAYDPHLVVVALGTNDTYGTVADYETSMRSLISQIRAHTNADGTHPVVVLLQPPIAMSAVYGTRSGYTGYISNPYVAGNPYVYGRPRTTGAYGVPGVPLSGGVIEFKNKVSALGAELGLAVAPVWDNLAALGWSGETNVSNAYISDGVHLTTAGSSLVGSYARTAVETQLYADGSVNHNNAIDFDLALPLEPVVDAIDFDLALPGQYTDGAIDFDLALPQRDDQLTPPAFITARLAASASGARDTASIVGGERWSARVEAFWP